MNVEIDTLSLVAVAATSVGGFLSGFAGHFVSRPKIRQWLHEEMKPFARRLRILEKRQRKLSRQLKREATP